METKKLKIAILSDSVTIPTGFRCQSLQLVQYLTSLGHEVFYLGNAYTGMPIKNFELYDGTKCNFIMYGEMTHSYFRTTMSKILKDNMIDRFIILLDTFMLYPWFTELDLAPAKTFFWYPTDGGGGLPVGCLNVLKKVNVPVAMSKFGQKQILDYYGLRTEYIPHGINTGLFYRLADEKRLELRKKFGLENKWVIGVVCRNQPRKQLDKTLKTMRLVADKLPDAVLFMHLDPDDPAQPLWNIRSLIVKFGLENRVRFSGMTAFHGFPEKEMVNVYNVMDCYLSNTSGEGFGIPIIEAMCCEVPVVVTDYTTCPELVINHNAGYGIRLAGVETLDMFSHDSKAYDKACMNGTITGSWEVERGICDVSDAATKLISLHDNPDRCKEFGKNGRTAVLAEYDFTDIVGPAWMELLK